MKILFKVLALLIFSICLISCSGRSQTRNNTPSMPQSLIAINGTLYFSAETLDSGIELWKSDGTASGTVIVKDINPGVSSSTPLYPTNVNGTLFFVAIDGSHGKELWKSDGSSMGTVIVKVLS